MERQHEQTPTLSSFDLSSLWDIEMNLPKETWSGFQQFIGELSEIVSNPEYKPEEWKKMSNENVVGEVWSQNIGSFTNKNSIHRFSLLYVANSGLAIKSHGHNEEFLDPKGFPHIRKITEWYIFPDGSYTYCGKDKKHSLINSFEEPIYVLSIKKQNRKSFYKQLARRIAKNKEA